jgi:hypothetical protein
MSKMKKMKPSWIIPLIAGLFVSRATIALSHPSSGIVVNDQGEVFFVHSARGVAKLSVDGKLSYVHQSTGGHWLCLDPQGSFSRTQPRFFQRITPDGMRPAVIFADGGAPIAVGQDGNLYYGSSGEKEGENEPGAFALNRLSPDGTSRTFAPKLKEAMAKAHVGITGLAAGSGGSIYVSTATTILKAGQDAAVTVLVDRPEVKDCDPNPPPDGLPGFQGLAVTTDGTVFAAATGCRVILKISPRGTCETVLKPESPWSPTGVAIHAGELYVLEWTNPSDAPETGWRPRVRKVAADGKVTTLATIQENVGVNRKR